MTAALVVARILAREPRQRARLVIIFRLRFQSAGDVALRVVGRRRLEHIGLRRLGNARRTVNDQRRFDRSEEHTSELQSLMRISYAVFCLKKKTTKTKTKMNYRHSNNEH